MENFELIAGSLDQTVPAPYQETLDEVDRVIDQAVAEKDYDVALDEAVGIVQQAKVAGIALCKLLYKLNAQWSSFSDKNDFYEIVYDRIGLKAITVDRYISIWALTEQRVIPSSFKEAILQQPLRNLVPVAKMIEQGYQPQEEEWRSIAHAPDNSTILAVVRAIKGDEPRKSALLIFLDAHGNLTATKEGKTVDVGYFNLNLLADELVSSAISRIVDNAHIMRKE